jgi:hypothetical protein
MFRPVWLTSGVKNYWARKLHVVISPLDTSVIEVVGCIHPVVCCVA